MLTVENLLDEYAPKLDAFVHLFLKWNQRINLSAARTESDVREHVRDSLHVVPLLRMFHVERVLDVGSGGGFPLLIAAICSPGVQFVSLEPVHKKQAFLRTAARELGLAVDARAERLEQHERRDYDLAMSRATFDLAEWLDRAAAYVRSGGHVVGFEGEHRPDVLDVERHTYALGCKQRALVVRSVR